MPSLRLLVAAACFLFGVSSGGTAAADETSLPPRQRKDPTLFAWGIATAVTGGLVSSVGALMVAAGIPMAIVGGRSD